MKSVLIVGAGPAGLVAAKTLLQRSGSPFHVTIFEAAERVGGMWMARKDQDGPKCDSSMPTNLSRFTVSFSDLSWRSVKVENEPAYASGSAPMFPKAYQVGQYLEEYARIFLSGAVVALNREVTHAKLEGESRTWHVSSIDKVRQTTHKDSFDYLIVASGFFADPNHSLPANGSSQASIQHSSKFRSIPSLTNNKAGNIVVVGGGISGSEAAATVALQLSHAKYAPENPKPTWSQSKVYHVFDRPFYCLPRFLPRNPYNKAIQDSRLAPDFLPLDLVLYDLSRRGEGTISASNGIVPPEKARKGHEFIRSIIGGDQRDIGHPELVYGPDQTVSPAYTGISDTYSEFVRSGLIVPVQGRADTVANEDEQTTVQVSHSTRWASTSKHVRKPLRKIDKVVGIIAATGFQVQLDYLAPEVRQALDYDASSQRVPVLLSRGSIFNPNVPEMAFVGFYQGPYWGVMEMQAHLIARKWTGEVAPDSPFFISTEESKTVREALRQESLSVPQFWMPDYIGMMEEFSRAAHLQREHSIFPGQTGPVFPARYADPASQNATQPSDTSSHTAAETIREVHSLLDPSNNGTRFVAAAAFRAMQGSWTLRRKIDSHHPSSPGGTLQGTAHFHPRYSTSPPFSAEYLYIEQGTFSMDNGFSFPATRRYVYRYNERTDEISTWFVKEDGESAERIFTELVFKKPVKEDGSEDTEKGWLAISEHWCSPDTYKSQCEFRFRGAALASFGITYTVEGPSKDYTHESWYERPVMGAA